MSIFGEGDMLNRSQKVGHMDYIGIIANALILQMCLSKKKGCTN